MTATLRRGSTVGFDPTKDVFPVDREGLAERHEPIELGGESG